VGGISVLTKLNPWVVGLHFVVSGILIACATVLVWRVYENRHVPVPYRSFMLAPWLAVAATIAVLVGVVVTGAGPHAGDALAPRNGLDLEWLQHFHSYPAYATLGLAAIIWFTLRQANKDKSLALHVRISSLLLGALVFQAAIGVAQSRLGVPPVLVGLHMLGASVIVCLITFQWLSLRAK
jgi:cytochrome c oxidase assembly protein subunit 15